MKKVMVLFPFIGVCFKTVWKTFRRQGNVKGNKLEREKLWKISSRKQVYAFVLKMQKPTQIAYSCSNKVSHNEQFKINVGILEYSFTMSGRYNSLEKAFILSQQSITCSKLTIETLETNGVVLVFLLLTLNILTPCSSVSIVNFKQVHCGWEVSFFAL